MLTLISDDKETWRGNTCDGYFVRARIVPTLPAKMFRFYTSVKQYHFPQPLSQRSLNLKFYSQVRNARRFTTSLYDEIKLQPTDKH